METPSSIWLTVAHKLLASVLTDHGAVFPIRDVVHGTYSWWPGQTAAVWQAVLRCVEADTPPTPEAVIARLEDGAQPGYVRTIAGEFNEADNKRVEYYAAELRRWGMLADYRELGRKMASADDIDKIDDYIGYADVVLGGLGAQRGDREGDARSVSEQAWTDLETGDVTLIPTGMAWFDELSGGLWSGMDTWIAAAYKMGKSTLMRNWVLTAAERGHPVDVFNAEGSREMFALDCQAMLAARWLIQNGVRDLRMSGLFLRRVWAKKETAILKPEEFNAVQYARSEWERLPIWVWDARDGVTDLGTLTSQVRRSKMEHGMQACYLDYSQLFGKGETIFDRQSATALALQRMAAVENVAVVVLAQQNEATINRGGGDSHSPGIKGGGDAPAAADFLFTTKIDADCPNAFTVTLKLSRHTQRGISHDHAIEPASGLLIDKWVNIKREVLPDYSGNGRDLIDELPGSRRR